MSITYRSVKGFELEHAEVDENFRYLDEKSTQYVVGHKYRGPVVRIFDNKLYRLVDSVDFPYTATNFLDELANGDWVLINSEQSTIPSLDEVLEVSGYSERSATVGDFKAKSFQIGDNLMPESSGGLFKVQKNADGTISVVLDSVSHEDSDNFGRLTATLTNEGGVIFRHLANDNNEGVIAKIRKDGILFSLINSFLKVDKDGVARDVLLSGLAQITDIINLESTLNNKADLFNGIVPQEQSQGSSLIMDSSNYKIIYTDPRGEVYEIDLPIESLFRDANYDSETKKLILTLDSGDTIKVSLEDLVDLPEIQIENINPSVSPSDGKKVYFNISNGKIYLNYQNEWAFLGNAISDTEKSNINTAYIHLQATGNPHNTTKADIGLGNVDNTSDLNKPISNATQNALNLKLSIESPSTTGTLISFTTDKVYGTLTTPETGNITADVTNAKLGVTNIIIHNSGTAPTFDSKFKKLSGSGNYVTGVVNYIYCTYISTTEIIYSINQRA